MIFVRITYFQITFVLMTHLIVICSNDVDFSVTGFVNICPNNTLITPFDLKALVLMTFAPKHLSHDLKT